MEQYEYLNGPPAPRMVAELAMRHDALVKQLADAQATIAALQARVQSLEAELVGKNERIDKFESYYVHQDLLLTAEDQLTQRTAELHETQNHLADADNEVEQLRKQLSERTAELEAVREQMRLTNIDQANAEAKANDMQAELERVRALIKALPKVEGAVVVSNGYVKDSLERQIEQLREQNRVLARALENVLNAWVNGRKVRDGIPLEALEAALTATSQPGGTHEL